jgi:sugar fermentation stimulation protein A
MFFCGLHEGINRVSAAGQIDSRYRDTLLEVIEQGVEVLAWRANVTPEGIIMNRPLPFSVDPSE